MLRLANDQLTVQISPQGGAVTAARTGDGRDFLRPLSGPFAVRASSCYPLVPLGNRVGGNGFHFAGRDHQLRPNTSDPLYLHGDGWLADWTVAQDTPAQAVLQLDHLSPECGVHRYRAEQQFTLTGTTLRIGISVRNEGAAPLPFGLGLHPFMPNDGAQIEFNARAFWTEGPGSLPGDRLDLPPDADFRGGIAVPRRSLNNAYEGWDGVAKILWPDGRRLTLRADPIFSTLMVYAPETDRSFFCLEPMTHLPNALNMPGGAGMAVLAPGETLSGGVDFIVET